MVFPAAVVNAQKQVIISSNCSVEPAARPNRRTAPTLQQNQETTKEAVAFARRKVMLAA
jgi:hypothetical protein